MADLLDLSRISGGAMPLRIEINAVDELVGAARQRLRGVLAGAASCASIVDEGAPLLLGRFDLVQSVRVLVNLVENALKYSPDGAPVELSRRSRR